VTLAAFLKAGSVAQLSTAVPDEKLLLARSWQELDSLLAARPVNVAVLDPGASGSIDLPPVIRLLRKYGSVPFLAYVPLTEQHFTAIAALSTHGLADAIVHPADDRRICKTIETLSRTKLVRELLGSLEIGIGAFSPGLAAAVQDLFERPNRYETGADIAASARTAVKTVYRDFQAAGIGTPKKLVTVAKLLCGYAYLSTSHLSIREVRRKAGYSHQRVFVEHSHKVFGCAPSDLRGADRDEVVRSLLDWFYKPGAQSIGRKSGASRVDRAARSTHGAITPTILRSV
jgi:AraC-like DNA-binding protein